MLKKLKIFAKNEKQAVLKASEELNISENLLKASCLSSGEKKGLFGLFKDMSEYEVSCCSDEVERLKEFKVKDFVKIETFEEIEDIELRQKCKIAYEYLEKILVFFEFGFAKKEFEFCDNILKINLDGKNVAFVIGKFGRVLDALQYLVVLCANQLGGKYLRVIVDIGEYRKNRQIFVQNLTKKTAAMVVEKKIPITLEPMNPYERQLVHSEVSKIDFVYSRSFGKDPYRSVTIYPEYSKT